MGLRLFRRPVSVVKKEVERGRNFAVLQDLGPGKRISDDLAVQFHFASDIFFRHSELRDTVLADQGIEAVAFRTVLQIENCQFTRRGALKRHIYGSVPKRRLRILRPAPFQTGGRDPQRFFCEFRLSLRGSPRKEHSLAAASADA